MTLNLPRAKLSSNRSAFSLIDPATSHFYRQFDRHGFLTSGLRTHVAVSYVWSEWRDEVDDKLPSWTKLRTRLNSLLGEFALESIKSVTGNTSRCWIDCMCIDQNSPADKAYWIPRMDEVYHEARCTILLLRTPGLDLNLLLEIKQRMHCQLEGPLRLRDIAQMIPHNCLLCQSCTSLSVLDPDVESATLESLRTLCFATWRQRAWILQEILLSENYILSWNDNGDWISLADVGVIATLFFRRHLQETWLDEFASWCRKLWYLRQNYGTAQTYELCDANVLQLASGLGATVPSDKYYALCGIMRLKDVKPDPNHSADQALDMIIKALVKEGRMSWLYAVPPIVQNYGVEIRDGTMTPYILSRLEGRLSWNRKDNAVLTSHGLSLQAIPIGRVAQVLSLSVVLDTAFTHLREKHDFGFPESISYCARVPDVIRRLSLDIVDPLLSEPMFGNLCTALGLHSAVKSEARKGWLCVFFLSFIDEDLIQELCKSRSAKETQIVRAASKSLQHHLVGLRDSFCLVFWKDESDESQSANISVAFSGCPADASVFSLKNDQQLKFAACPSEGVGNHAKFYGSIFTLDVRDTIGPRPSTLLTTSFWKKWKSSPEAYTLNFKYRTIAV